MRAERPLSPGQLAALQAAAGNGDAGRTAASIAALAGLKVDGVYMVLGRMVRRGLLERSGSRPPRYTATAEGVRALGASEAFYRAIGGEG